MNKGIKRTEIKHPVMHTQHRQRDNPSTQPEPERVLASKVTASHGSVRPSKLHVHYNVYCYAALCRLVRTKKKRKHKTPTTDRLTDADLMCEHNGRMHTQTHTQWKDAFVRAQNPPSHTSHRHKYTQQTREHIVKIREHRAHTTVLANHDRVTIIRQPCTKHKPNTAAK